uniref:TGF-beta propeptide domain-containing protein n=1 Tax=Cacopsylla melanoneura TaxID=428564 RepID=A0A8D9AX41_9HEMI
MGINSTEIAADIEHLKPPSYSPVSEGYAEKIQSFYPSCEMPRNTTTDLWKNNGTVMNLFFNNIQSVLATSNILKAKLRLFKHSRSAENFIPHEEGCPQTPQDEKPEADNPLEPKPVEERLIRVSIYWYTRPLKRIKDKKKLLDSQMLSLNGEEWTEWNIKPAVNAWKEYPNKNFGLSIIVEDEDGVRLPVDKLFSPMNCSNEASTEHPPLPFFFYSHRDSGESPSAGTLAQVGSYWPGSAAYRPPLYPIIDLSSVSTEVGGHHKLRHHNHHRTVKSIY